LRLLLAYAAAGFVVAVAISSAIFARTILFTTMRRPFVRLCERGQKVAASALTLPYRLKDDLEGLFAEPRSIALPLVVD
jgi:hypothetical protein